MKNKNKKETAKQKKERFFTERIERRAHCAYLADCLNEKFDDDTFAELFDMCKDLLFNYIKKNFFLKEDQINEAVEKAGFKVTINWDKWDNEKYSIEQFFCYQAFCAANEIREKNLGNNNEII